MINVVQQGYYDVVIGTKDMTAENRSLLRSVVSFGKRVISRPFLPTGVVDSQTGLKVMSSVAVKRMFPAFKGTARTGTGSRNDVYCQATPAPCAAITRQMY